jgi:hypothetical protein
VIGADSRTVSAPSVKATAAGDVVLTTDGDLWVDSISSLGGNVVVNAPNGKVLNLKNSTSADALGQALVEQAWSRLQLTGAGAEQRLAKTVTNYEEQVGTRFQAYRQLLRHGDQIGLPVLRGFQTMGVGPGHRLPRRMLGQIVVGVGAHERRQIGDRCEGENVLILAEEPLPFVAGIAPAWRP